MTENTKYLETGDKITPEPLKYDTFAFLKELDMIQVCIARMAANSASMKTYAICILFAGLILQPPAASPLFCAPWVLLLCVVWGLDAYFLRLERAYRRLYDFVRRYRPAGNTDALYSLNPAERAACISFPSVAFSATLLSFYGALLGVLGVVSAVI